MKPAITHTAQELADILGISERAVRKRALSERWAHEERPNPRGGGVQKSYPASALPSEIRDKIAAHKLQRSLSPETAMACRPAPLPVVTRSALAAVPIPERSDKIGLAKFRIVTKWREIVASQPWGKKDEATEAFLTAYRSGRLLPEAWNLIGDLSAKTLYRLDKLLRDHNDDYAFISDGRGGWRKHGTTKWRERELSNDTQEEFLACWLQPNKPSVSLAIRAARLNLERRGIIEPANEATWRRWLHDWERTNQDIVVLARQGEKAYRDKIGPYATRDASCLTVGQVLVADGHDLNFQSIHPVTGRPARLKLIVFFDWASRYPVGWQIMPTESTMGIHAALRSSIINLKKYPQSVYLDNGKAFKSKVFTESDPALEDLRGIYGRLGIATTFAQPYNGRAKVVERFFLTVGHQFERIIPTYCGANIEDKPAWLLRNEKLHRAWQAAKTQGWIPDIRETAHLVNIYFKWYASQPHDGLGGRTPQEVFDAGIGPGVDVADLTERFLWAKKAKASRCRVTVYGIQYESDCLHGITGDVICRFDASALNTVYCYLPDGGYLGEARPVEALHPLATLFGDEVAVDQVQNALRRQRKLLKETKAGLLGLGADPKDVDEGLAALPWNQRAVVSPGGKSVDAPPVEPQTDEAERTRLELVHSQIIETPPEPEIPEIERPKWIGTEYDRYEWAFRALHQSGARLSEEDVAFMRYFETTPEYKKNYRQRYEDLKELYSM